MHELGCVARSMSVMARWKRGATPQDLDVCSTLGRVPWAVARYSRWATRRPRLGIASVAIPAKPPAKRVSIDRTATSSDGDAWRSDIVSGGVSPTTHSSFRACRVLDKAAMAPPTVPFVRLSRKS
eukprot:scaffold80120_cov37-Tisochrysis_lutea.AAC.4